MCKNTVSILEASVWWLTYVQCAIGQLMPVNIIALSPVPWWNWDAAKKTSQKQKKQQKQTKKHKKKKNKLWVEKRRKNHKKKLEKL